MELQVKHLIRDIEKISNDTFLKNIQVRTIVARDLWTVVGDPTQLHQVLLNLCVNARDAMPDGGTLTLSAQNLTLDAHYAGLDPEARPGPYVLIQVEDTGTGMPPEILDKIFDPFFTTKEVGKGTGLGLSTSLAIIKSHGGFIRVDSLVGRGTKFELYLPAQTEPSANTAAAVPVEMPRGHGELILVVDDEATVRQVTRQTLGSIRLPRGGRRGRRGGRRDLCHSPRRDLRRAHGPYDAGDGRPHDHPDLAENQPPGPGRLRERAFRQEPRRPGHEPWREALLGEAVHCRGFAQGVAAGLIR